MSLMSAVGVLLLALLVLVFCAEKAVDRVLELLEHYELSATFGGLTVFSLMTSLPELFSHIVASIGILSGRLDYQIASSTVLGANIGSDVVQQTLILGLVVLFMGGMTFDRKFLLTAYLPMIGTTLLTLILGWDRSLSRIDGGILLAAFVAYNIYLYSRERAQDKDVAKNEDVEEREPVSPVKNILISLFLFVLILLSAHFLLMATETIVEKTGFGGSLVGVVTLGIASAAPEMFTAISGLRKGQAGISLGTLIGSNITNPLVAIGGGALLSTYHVPGPLVLWDLPMETVTAALLLAYLLLEKKQGYLGRIGGVYLVTLYIVYLVARVLFFSVD